MRFLRIRIHSFGGIEELDTGPEPLPGMVVVHGPNEAGKSTFFHFVTSLLYGFYPATREANPYTPWSGRDASGEATLVLDGEDRLEVHRRLLASPTGSLVRNGRTEELRNRTLPCVEHVPLTVFRQVFALTLRELVSLEGESWARVQDRLVTGMGTSDLLPAREVAEELETEAGRLWRPNHRGNQVVRDLRERVRELTARRRTAAEADREIREKNRELARVRGELGRAREERAACKIYLERYRALRPIRDQLDRIAGLEEAAGPVELLDALPADPGERLDQVADTRRQHDRRISELDEELEHARARIDAYNARARRLVEERTRIRTVVGRVGGLEPVRVRIGQVEQERRDLQRRTAGLAEELLAVSLEEVDTERLRRLPAGRIRELVEELRDAVDAVRVAESALPAPPSPPGRWPPPWIGYAALGAGLALLVIGIVTASIALTAAGAMAAAVGGGLSGAALARHRPGENAERLRAEASTRLREARRREEEARERLSEAMADLPLRPDLTRRPGGDLPARLEQLQELLRTREDRTTLARELEEEVEGVRSLLDALGEELGRDLPDDPAAAAHVLEEALREAERLGEAAAVTRPQVERLENERERLRSEIEAVSSEEETLERTLADLGEGDLTLGVRRAKDRLQARERARQLRSELERNHPDLVEIEERIREAEEAGEDWVVDDRALARKKAREEELTREIEDLTRREERLEREIAHRKEEDTVDEVEGELRAVREQIEAAVRERDRLHLLACVLRQADRRFREEHQPEVLRRTAEYLATITDGRYERVLVGEDRDDATFLLRGPGYPGPVEVAEPVSTGTREQLYLALRLAVLDHLDGGGEKLPLVMDEAFVNWDRDRRERAFDLLESVAETRQVFVLTCHQPMAEALHDRGAGLLELPRAL